MTQNHRYPGNARCSIFALLASLILVNQATAEVQLNFVDDNGLDGQGIGGSMSATDPATSLKFELSTVEIRGRDGSLASTGTANVMHSESGSNALGVDSINTDNVAPNENDARDFDPGEAWTFSFDVDVELVEANFAGWAANASEITLSFSDGTPDKVLFDSTSNAVFDLGNTLIHRGTKITMELTNTPGDPGVRLESLVVNAVIPTPPSVSGLIYDEGDGTGVWTTTTPSFIDENDEPAIFQNGDDAVFDKRSNLAVAIQSQGIIADDVAWTNSSNGTLKFLGGDLTAGELIKVNSRGSIAVQNTTVTDRASLYKTAYLKILDGGTLTVDSLFLAGSSFLQLDTGGTYHSGTTTLGGGGVRFRNAITLTLGPVLNQQINNRIRKDGDGNLVFTEGLGAISNTPADLDILAGTVTISGTERINIGGDSEFVGDLIMNGAELTLHGSAITGSGVIRVQESSIMSTRSDAGPNLIYNTIVIDAGRTLTVDSATYGDELRLEGTMIGGGNLIKRGDGIMIIDSSTTGYQGSTTVEDGSLRMWAPILSDGSAVFLSGNGNLDLPHGGPDTVDSLFMDGIQMEAGTYGSSFVPSVTLDVVNDTHFSGSGYLVVLNGPPDDDYAAWAAGFGLVGGMEDDDDGDGVSNGDEYVFGLDPTSSASLNPMALPLDATTGTFSYTRRNPTAYATGVIYRYDYSLTLDNDWTDITGDASEVSDNGIPVETVTVTVPASLLGNRKLFIRVTGASPE